MEPVNGRRYGREWALQMLVQADLNPFATAEMILKHFWEQQWSFRQEEAGKADDDMDEVERVLEPARRLATPELTEFTEKLVRGTLADVEALDKDIAATCDHWSIDRLGVIERCVLRLGVYEMTQLGTPVPVVINECVELAKYFSNAEAGAYVNGVLDRYAKNRRARG